MSTNLTKARDYALDNIRFFLIFTVVFAHLLEVCNPFGGVSYIYKFIYIFHMPVFIFMFGYNAKYSPKKILLHWLIPYLVFQILYILFTTIILKSPTKLQFTVPYWILWYMIVCIFYQLLIPLYNTDNKWRQLITIVCVLLFSLVSGYINSIGYYMSLSRFFVFQIWFVLGYYCKKNDIFQKLTNHPILRNTFVSISVIIIILSIPLVILTKLPTGLLNGSYPYATCNSTIWMRILVFTIALSWIVFLFAGIRNVLNKQIFAITKFGQNTLPIFLFHGFLVKALAMYHPAALTNPIKVLISSLLIIAIFGNKFFTKIIHYLCFWWIEK